MATDIEKRCSERLRTIRREKGLTLHQCEELSGGEVKAVVLGSYERGTRAISLARLTQLAELYNVPLQYFLGTQQKSNEVGSKEGFIFDLRKVRRVADGDLVLLSRYLQRIIALRSDWNGEVISLRLNDSENLSLIFNRDGTTLTEYLRLQGLLFAGGVSGQRSL
jgi:transcriptional regulator with XRE-family HTH domain